METNNGMKMGKQKKKEYDQIYYLKNKFKRDKQNRKNYHAKYKYNISFCKKRVENTKKMYHTNKQYRRKAIIRAKTRKLFAKTKKECFFCKVKKNLQLHHPNYSKWNKIICVCSLCHAKLHSKTKWKDGE